jgi:glycosyltransferase involved in cell wall biosynthesis
LRVVFATTPGKTHAIRLGFAEARYDTVCIVDDDNWLEEDWVSQAATILARDPAVGLCVGQNEAVFEEAAPEWFARFSSAYAVGELGPEPLDITWVKGAIWGAGTVIRKRAWEDLGAAGYKPTLLGRVGTSLMAGEDAELGRALRLAGWKLQYDPGLKLRHFMPAARMRWDYLLRLQRGAGASTAFLDAYNFAVKKYRVPAAKIVMERWSYQVALTVKDLVACGGLAAGKQKRAQEGSEQAVREEFLRGRLDALWASRSGYGRRVRGIRRAPWRKVQFAPRPGSR